MAIERNLGSVWARCVVGCCCLGLLATLGCGSNSLGTVDVTGKVLLDDQPVEGATVVFSPDDSEGRAASGITDANGEFTLTTEINGDGALPGSYKVAVTKYEVESDSGIPTDVDPDDPGSMDDVYSAADKAGVREGRQAEAKNAIASMYANAAGSGLTAQVTEDGENHFEFKVTSK